MTVCSGPEDGSHAVLLPCNTAQALGYAGEQRQQRFQKSLRACVMESQSEDSKPFPPVTCEAQPCPAVLLPVMLKTVEISLCREPCIAHQQLKDPQ